MLNWGHGGSRLIASGVPAPTNEVPTKGQWHSHHSCRTVRVRLLRSIKNDAVRFVGDPRTVVGGHHLDLKGSQGERHET